MYKATNMFASSTKAEHFYELFLLPRVREDIRIHKKLHFCLYQSLKKSLFKPKGFYCGILLPLCKSGTCTIPEAVIIGSIIHKFSIPENFSSAALVCLAEMEFLGTRSYFMKAILEKKYALAHLAIDAVAAHFLRFRKETKVMPTTPEIVRELISSRNRGEMEDNSHSASTIKEDWFDMPQVPMEED
ncbi:hypothetical protein IGI04_026441 [Brassica rapa subsp. trilocularis]|uniref:Cyclin C-terminal domain-containing protein n=1 Tax=Brassica rapa subsp. trilocularis TaxID=1813537 RepID=A0ABQ7KZ69_BRACM|nr:hypothetical protein IGI04_026441 [Brassica rapa subsp. trilocularis]